DRRNAKSRSWFADKRSDNAFGGAGDLPAPIPFLEKRALAQTPTPNELPKKTGERDNSGSQLFCCKSIDKLISDSEEPERRLKKTLCPVSFAARRSCRVLWF